MDEKRKRKNEPKEYQISDIVIEVLEVAVNLILYVRNIYPDGIFQRSKIYNCSVMMCQHPDVNAYIKDVLDSIKCFVADGTIEKVVIQITNNNIPLERFVFEMKLTNNTDRQCYFDMEAHLRAVLLKLNTCEAMLKPVPDDSSFQVLAYTRSSTLSKMEAGINFPEFPWVVVEDKTKYELSDPLIIPLRSCNTNALKLQCYVEEYSNKS